MIVTKKARTYMLLVCVLCIWGILGFRIVEAIRPGDPSEVSDPGATRFNPMTLKARDTFSIKADYRDPFLGTLPNKPVVKVKESIAKKPQLPEGHVIYEGFVNDMKSGSRIFFVRIGDKQHMMQIGETLEEISLIGGSESELTIRYNGSRHTITRLE